MRVNSISNKYYNNYPLQPKGKQNNPSFNGFIPEPVVNHLSGFYDKVAQTHPFQKFITKFSTSDNSFKHLMFAESCFLSGFYMLNTLRNKKIKKEQKPQMIINDTLTLGVSSAGAYLLDGKVTNIVNKFAEKYFVKHKDFYTQLGANAKETLQKELLNKTSEITAISDPTKVQQAIEEAGNLIGSQMKQWVGEEGKLKAFQITKESLGVIQTKVKDAISNNIKNADGAKKAVADLTDDVYKNLSARMEADKIIPGINKLKVLVILGLIYRFVGPVVITPIANKLSSKLFKNTRDDKQAK